MARIFVTTEEAGIKLNMADDPLINELVSVANILVDNYVLDTVLETNSLAKLATLKYIQFMGNQKDGIKSINDIDLAITYESQNYYNSLPPFISKILDPIKKPNMQAEFRFL